MSDELDLTKYIGTDKSDTSKIEKILQRYLSLESKAAEIKSQLTDLEEEMSRIVKDTLPSAMAESGIDTLTTTSGYRIAMTNFVSASIPGMSAIEKKRGEEKEKMLDKREAWFEWLRENGHDGLIKNEVKASFGRGEDERAKEIVDSLMEQGISTTQQESVHSRTLTSFVKEQIGLGTDFPEELGVFQGEKAEIKKAR